MGAIHGEVTTIGLDLAKHVFQVHGVDAEGATVLRKQLRRAQVLAKSYDFFRKGEFFEPTGSVSKAKIRAVTRVLEGLGDLPSNIDIDKLFLPA
jgi:hypothetical protein